MTKKKKTIIISLLAIILLVVAAGFTYAWLTKTVQGQKEYTLKAGTLSLTLDESSSDGISLLEASPLSDAEGIAQEVKFTFTVENKGTIAAGYKIYLDDDTIDSSDVRIDDSNIKYQIKAVGSGGSVKLLSDGRCIEKNNLAVGGKKTYELRLWLKEDSTANYNEVFSGKLRIVASQLLNDLPVADTLLAGVGKNGAIDTTDSEQTFITGTNPNNYIWYSGKLWRAVSIDPSDNSVKLVTQWNISSIPYNASGNTAFEGSYMQQWLNDTTRDGFLGNLREPEKFIKMDSAWNATQTTATTKPAKTTMVTSAVGLLNMYEYTMSYKGTTYSNGYLNNGLYWWTLTPDNTSSVRYVASGGKAYSSDGMGSNGGRPAINLKSSVEIVSGSGTASDPYRLKGDNDTPASGTKLATRYSGEYIRFGTGENNLYQIVSHETEGTTKIVSAIPLKENYNKQIAFASSGVNYSSSNTIGAFLNGEYLTSGSYLTTDQVNMIEDNTTWYLGTVGNGTSYKLAKYASASSATVTSNTTTAKVGLLRLGELNSGQFDKAGNNTDYWTLTPYNTSNVRYVISNGAAGYGVVRYLLGGRPTINLKSDVMITGGDGTKENPFEVKLAG